MISHKKKPLNPKKHACENLKLWPTYDPLLSTLKNHFRADMALKKINIGLDFGMLPGEEHSPYYLTDI